MRSLRTCVCLGAVLLAFGSRARADEPDVRGIPPLVMLVVDTSGSMEELPACTCRATNDCSNCVPNCLLSNDTTTGEAPTGKKDKWAVTLEALTGKFKNFECMDVARANYPGTVDANFGGVYHQPWKCANTTDKRCDYPGTSGQEKNGILDNYRDTLNFGLITFDGEPTYLGELPLVSSTKFDETLSQGIQGMWSYGTTQTFKYPGCTDTYAINTGARSAKADEGAMISLSSPVCSTPPCDIFQINDAIQTALVKARPYGGTPIASSLEDLYLHLQNEVNGKDKYQACRDRYAFLITDGAPDADFRDLRCNCEKGEDALMACPTPGTGGDFKCPYETAPTLAKKLVAGGSVSEPPQIKKLFVLGMSVNDTEKKLLDDIAKAGGSDKAMAADDPNTLRATLDNVFGPLLNPVSRSVPAFATGATGIQYQISAGFQVSPSSASSVAPPWKGLIERRRFICNASTGEIESPDLTPQDNLDIEFNNRTPSRSRNLYTALPTGSFTKLDLTKQLNVGDTAADKCGTRCPLVELSDAKITADLLTVGTAPAERDGVLAWMYGDAGTRRATAKLGDIYHSSAAVVGPPKDEPGDEAYTRFRTDKPEISRRPLIMYIASNDGVLHALSVEDYQAPAATKNAGDLRLPLTPGKELWGFIPPVLIQDLHNQLDGHQYNFDGTPVVKDVFFQRTTNAQDTDYHTVLITGMRGGGHGYIAMDVTDPFNPVFLWQFTDDDMGLTYGQPEIVQATFKFKVKSTDTETVQTRAVAILPGGKGLRGAAGDPGCFTAFAGGATLAMRNASNQYYQSWREDDPAASGSVDHRKYIQCWKQQARSLYFVDVETGKLIKKLLDDDKDLTNGTIFPSAVIGSPTAYPDSVGTVATRGFVVDADGVVWRIDMSETDPLPDDGRKGWTVRPFHDLFWDTNTKDAGEVSYERPILSLDPQRRLVVLVGTGDTDNFTKPTADNRIVSMTEVTRAAQPSVPDDWQALINWELRNVDTIGTGFVPSELVTGSMALFEGQLFAASFISTAAAKPCEQGYGRLWSVHYIERDKSLGQNPISKYSGAVTPLTYPPKRIPVDAATDADSDSKLWNILAADAAQNLLIQGLGTTQRLSCAPPDPNPLDSYFSPSLANIVQSQPPAIWVVAQASSGAKRAGSRLGSVQTKIKRPTTFSRVTSWASSVD